MNIKTAADIGDIREDLDLETRTYLNRHGWKQTCDTPGSLWLWSRVYKGKTILVDQVHAVAMQVAFESGIYDPEAT